ncbi:NAD(P)H-dependent oxidoreductase [Panacibacter sp. DH6]|uniref:NAD(P)H-dependent oxidoreductase n=1 Tax=Panacibacter microcysteis TaxID=2793269 RepID=A0A931E528_9BACT|nr:NAD(P)H-dependent oxidoreductase [Panacibacter microcysteis]MBG9375143.1 NAD(P)H-dependent oxidoreductase [Panacibacter microcysteis]
MNIEIISGSPRQESLSRRVAVFLQRYMREKTEHNINLIDVREWSLPLLQQEVFTSVERTPEALQPLAKRMFDADAFIMVTPEYNGSYTPALKNLFDHFPKQTHKTFGIVTASPGIMGGMRATQQMQLLINALFGIGSPHMLVTPMVDKKFNAEGNLTDLSFQKNVDVFVSEFLWLAEALAPELQPAQ